MFTTRFENQSFRLPDFIIPGAAKSGTTSLYQMLAQHPSIYFPPSRKEPFYFSFGGEKPTYTDEKFNELPIWRTSEYLKLYRDAEPDQICGDASTSYLYTAEKSIKLIREMYGDRYRDLKIIILLRNPIDRAYSHYTYLIRNGFETRSFEEAISEKGIAEWKSKRWGFDYLAYGAYANQVAAFKNTFPETKVWLLEDLKNGNRMISEIFQFLNVSTIDIKRVAKANPSGIPKNRGVVNLLRRNPIIKTIGKSLPSSMQQSLKGRRDRLMSKFLEKRPMNPETREKLQRHYREDIARLQEVIGRNLEHWLHSVTSSENE